MRLFVVHQHQAHAFVISVPPPILEVWKVLSLLGSDSVSGMKSKCLWLHCLTIHSPVYVHLQFPQVPDPHSRHLPRLLDASSWTLTLRTLFRLLHNRKSHCEHCHGECFVTFFFSFYSSFFLESLEARVGLAGAGERVACPGGACAGREEGDAESAAAHLNDRAQPSQQLLRSAQVPALSARESYPSLVV